MGGRSGRHAVEYVAAADDAAHEAENRLNRLHRQYIETIRFELEELSFRDMSDLCTVGAKDLSLVAVLSAKERVLPLPGTYALVATGCRGVASLFSGRSASSALSTPCAVASSLRSHLSGKP